VAPLVESFPLQFTDAAALARSLRGAPTVYNTYWIRFQHGGSTFDRAVANTRVLLEAARDAGVERFVHVSVTNAGEDSPLPYFRGKAAVERAVVESGIPYAIVRPTLIFGPRDVLVNNIAWILRRFPFFVVPGRGDYRLQPVSVEDTATIAVDAAGEAGNVVVDAAGPETYTFEQLVRLVADATGRRARIVHASPLVALALVAVISRLRRDVLLTREELAGLTASLLVSNEPPRGRDSFRDWVLAHGDELGSRYVSELARNYGHAPL
jgi:uncharacterized protein YbjT (DUF2867 family)